MIKQYLFFSIILFSVHISFAQLTVNQDQLAKAVKDKMMEEVSNEITSSIQRGEAWVANETYFSTVLEPFEDFGINPSDPQFLTSANGIYEKIKKELDDDPSLNSSSLLKSEIKGIVSQGLMNYASSYIDSDSKEIVSQISSLIADGQKKIEELLEITDEISNFDPSSLDYESQVTATLKSYGFKSDYFDKIDDLDMVLSTGYEKLVDPITALYTICTAMDSDDPIEKIEILFELGESYGGKVPIIGDLIVPLFTLAKGVLDAAIGLENVLEKNLNQGCINAEGGNFGAHRKGNKSYNFIKKFPNAGYVCPMNMGVYHPVYNNIYFSMDLDDADETYFLMNKVWLRGKNDKLHKGRDDISKSIQWLRRNQYTEEATNLEFVFTAFQKEYGWSVYTEEVTKRIQRIKQLFKYSYTTVNICEDSKLEKFYMEKMGLGWIKRLLDTDNNTYTWNNFKHFDTIEAQILNKMIYNYYMSKHQPNLERLDQIIKQFEEQMPIHIYGTVSYENGTLIEGATLQVGHNSMFERRDKDHKIVTASNGSYSYFLLMKFDAKIGITVSVVTKDSEVKHVSLPIEANLKTYEYKVPLILASPEPDNPANENTVNVTGSPSNDPPTDPGINPPIDISFEITNSDCAKDPHGIAEWDAVNQRVICSCEDFYTWDETAKKCVANVQEILANSDCSQWPNTEPKWDIAAGEPYCDCIEGYIWHDNLGECISILEALLAEADCSQYLNAEPIWDEVNQKIICECLPGFVWDKDRMKCISENQKALQNRDCSMFPNTEAKWDPVNKETYCDCLPGYEWAANNSGCIEIQTVHQTSNPCAHLANSRAFFDPVLNETVCDCLPGFMWNRDQSACIPIPKKPKVDWDNILTMTLGVMNAVNPNNQGLIPTSSAGSMTGMPQQATHKQSNCNDQQQAGANVPEVHTIDLGQSYGTFVFDYETFNEEDQIIITNGGVTIFNSGCVGENKRIQLNLRGISPTITVRVNPNCDGGTNTAWNFTVHCPNN